MENNFKDGYFKWLYDNTTLSEISRCTFRLTLPFLDRNNDCTEVFIKNENGNYTITDDGETLGKLSLSNFNIFSSKKELPYSTVYCFLME